MNVVQCLINHARQSAKGLRESHTPASSSIDFAALDEADGLDKVADLAQVALSALGMRPPGLHTDDGA